MRILFRGAFAAAERESTESLQRVCIFIKGVLDKTPIKLIITDIDSVLRFGHLFHWYPKVTQMSSNTSVMFAFEEVEGHRYWRYISPPSPCCLIF